MAEYVIKQDRQGQFYWILRSTENNRTVAVSSEPYATRAKALQAIVWTQKNADTPKVEDETE